MNEPCALDPSPLSESFEVQSDPLAIQLEREIRSGRIELPVLPQVATEVRELLDRDADTRAVVKALEREPTVAAALIRYANAAVFAGLPDVKDLHQAIMRLGRASVRNTVVSLSAKGAFAAQTTEHRHLYEALWMHSITTAIAARRLAVFGAVSGETAFLAGLIHDIGKVVVLRGIEVLRQRDSQGCSIQDHNILDFMDALHCPVGDFLCQAWNIPLELRVAVMRHHEVNLTGAADTLTAVVQVANLMATKIGASLRPNPGLKFLDKPAVELLRLDDVKIASLLVDIEDEHANITNIL